MGAIQSGINQLLGITAIAGMTPAGQKIAKSKDIKQQEATLGNQWKAISQASGDPTGQTVPLKPDSPHLQEATDIAYNRENLAREKFSIDPTEANYKKLRSASEMSQRLTGVLERRYVTPEQAMQHMQYNGRGQVQQRRNLANFLEQTRTGSGPAFTNEERADLLRSIGRGVN